MPATDPGTLILIPVIGLLAYRRVRRQIGRQPFKPNGLWVRLFILAIATTSLCFVALSVPGFALPVIGCLAGGALIGAINLRWTRFEWTTAGDYYHPHPIVGAALSMLLIGRLIYRFYTMGSMPGSGGPPPSIEQQGPLTLALAALLLGYYVTYLIGLLVVRARHHRSGAPRTAPADRIGP